jgi:hypothetical protein
MKTINAKNPWRFAIRLIFAVGVFATVLSVSTFASDTKEEFRDAARGTGCKLIPWEDLRAACYTLYGEQNEWCTRDKKLSCNDLDKDKPDDREIAKERRENASQCIAKRAEVKKAYDEALEHLEKESENPDPDVKQLASEIIEKIKAEQQGHATATEQTENRRRKCDDVYNGR